MNIWVHNQGKLSNPTWITMGNLWTPKRSLVNKNLGPTDLDLDAQITTIGVLHDDVPVMVFKKRINLR